MAENNLNVVIRGTDELTPELKRVESSVIRAVGAISASLAAIKIGAAPLIAAASFEKELANVAKTTDFASKSFQGGIGDLDKLSDALLNMSLRTNLAATELAKIAGAAGQLGFGDRFGVEGVIAFTDSVARMASVLDISAEKAATDLGKILNIFKTPIRDIEKAISIVNEVSNKTTASGEELLDVIKRIGTAAGSLNLQQAAGLAATGLDLGISPEVVGTAFSKVFSAFREEGDKFAKVVKGIAISTGEELTGSASEFIGLVERDGIEALKAYLKGLRKLNVKDQQIAIVKLVGGGRIGALFNKLVKDASDSVLNNALEAAAEGSIGLSALKEQATVMFTLSKQAEILRNSITKLGIDSASSFLPDLTQTVAQLSAALQTPQVKNFVNAIVGGFTDLLGTVFSVVKVVSDLNINWNNFVNLAKILLELKLAGLFLNLVAGASFFGVSLKSISKEAAAATAATQALGKATQSLAAAQVVPKGRLAGALDALGITQAIKKYKDYNSVVAEAKTAQIALTQATIDANNARGASAIQNARATSTSIPLNTASAATTGQRAALSVASKKLADAEVAEAQIKAARVAQAEQAGVARRLQIETVYQAEKTAISGRGSKARLAALEAEKARQLALDAAANAKSLAGIEVYYANRLAVQTASVRAEVAAERSALAATLLAQRAAQRTDNANKAGAAGAAAGSAAAAAGVLAATATAGRLKQAVDTAKGSLNLLGTAVSILGTVLATAGRVIASSFVWITILYSIADATGVLEKLGPVIEKITTFFGFNSKAARDAKIAIDEAADAAKKATAEFERSQEAYKKFINKDTGNIDQKKIDATVQIITNTDDIDKQREAFTSLVAAYQGNYNLIAQLQTDTTTGSAESQAKIRADIATTSALLLKAKADLQASDNIPAEYADRALVIQASAKAVEDLNEKLQEYAKRLRTSIQANSDNLVKLEETKKVQEELREIIGKFITNPIKPLLIEFSTPILNLQKEIDLLNSARDKAQKEFEKTAAQGGVDGGLAAKARVQETLQATSDALTVVEKKLKDAKESLAGFINKLKELGIPPEVLKQFSDLAKFIYSLPTATQETTLAVVNENKPSQNTGTAAIKPPKPTSGDGTISLKNEKAEAAQRLALARLALEKANREALAKLADEKDKQQLAKLQDTFDRGLVTIRNYHDEKEKIELKALAREVEARNGELAAINRELQDAKKEADKIRFKADIRRVEGEVAVLFERGNTIRQATAINIAKEAENFKKEILQETNKLVSDGLISSDAVGRFNSNLEELLLGAKTQIDKFRTSNQGALADALTQGITVKAAREAVAPITKQIDLSLGELGRTQARIADAREAGSITASDADRLQTAAIKEQLPALRTKLALMEQIFNKNVVSNLISPEAIAQDKAAIEDLRLRLDQLNKQQDLIAKDFNRSVSDSLNSALTKVLSGVGSARDIIKGLFNDIANSLRKAFADDLTSRISQQLGLTGSGGPGGLLQSILGGRKEKDTKSELDSVKRGYSAGTPLYVTNASLDLGDPGGFPGLFGKTPTDGQAPVNPVEGLLSETTKASDGFFSSVTEKFKLLGNSVIGTFTSVIGSLSNVISSLFSSAKGGGGGGGGIGGLLGSIFGSAGSGERNRILGVFAEVQHTGGFAGQGKVLRKVNPAIFADARRYHSGGVAGLKSDEVPAILQKGELVLTKNQQANLGSSGPSKQPSAPSAIQVTVHPDALHTTLGDWLNGELARQFANR